MPPPKIAESWTSCWTIVQLAGQTNDGFVCEGLNDPKVCTPTPTSPRRYHPPVSQHGAGKITGGGGGGMSAACAVVVTMMAATAAIKSFTLTICLILLSARPHLGE